MFIEWNADPVILNIYGPLAIRWYSLAFIMGFLIGERYCTKYMLQNGFTKDEISKGLHYVIAGCVIGARLGHCLFYEPSYYLANPLEILYVWKGGLASHGGFIGVMIGLYLFNKRVRPFSFSWLLDILAAPSLITGAYIRIGNLFNSEILGSPTDVPWAFIFKKVDNIPRHPSQLYEAIGYFTISMIGFYLYKRFHKTWPRGRFIGFILTFGFLHRFLVEFTKENQVSFESSMFWNMGQMLSIPMILLGVFLIFNNKFLKKQLP